MAHAQAPVWQTATAIATAVPGRGMVAVSATAADTSGNVYVAGQFMGAVTFGNTILTSLGGSDGFVTKWSSATGNFVWVQRVGGLDDDDVTAVAVTSSGIYLAGNFARNCSFGSTTLTSAGYSDAFIAKLADAGSTGSFTWVKQAGSTANDRATSLAVNGTSVYVAGSFSGSSAIFGPIHLSNATNTDDAFVTKLEDAGLNSSFIWAQRAGGLATDRVTAMAVNGSDVYIAGYFQGTASFGGTPLTSAGNFDGFVSHLIDTGISSNFLWTQRVGGPGYDGAFALAANGTSVYVAGNFTGTANFGSTRLRSMNTTDTDVFVAKITNAGTSSDFTWAERAGGPNDDYANALALNGSSVYVAGNIGNTPAYFGNIVLPTTHGGNDLFVARLTDKGSTTSFKWVQQAGGSQGDNAYGLAVTHNGTLYVGGYVSQPASFGALVFNNQVAGTAGFMASLTDTPTAPLTPLTTLSSAEPMGITVYPNPAHTNATVQLAASSGASQATFMLLDALGRTVRTHATAWPATGLRYELDLSGLSPGIYALRVVAGQRVATQRLIVE